MIAHNNLEEFNDPANYDLEEADSSAPRIKFYADLAQEIEGSTLEVACGTGLVALPVAERGLDVTGIDLARPMLVYAHSKAQRQNLHINLVEADARQFRFGKQFSFIYITGNAFQAFLELTDQERFLACVKHHLAPGGTFAFETRNPSGHDLSDLMEEEQWFSYRSVEGHTVCVSGIQRYDPLNQVLHWTSFRRWEDAGERHVKTTRIACRFTSLKELETLLHKNGFEITQQFGDWDKSEFTAESSTIILICHHKGENL